MTQNEIIEMAKQVGWSVWFSDDGEKEMIEAFAKLVAQHEREACAKIVEDSWMAFSRTPNSRLDITPFPELTYVAKAIRTRGQE